MSAYANSTIEDNYSRMREYLRLMRADYSGPDDFDIFTAYLVAVYLDETGIETSLKTAILQSMAAELGFADTVSARRCAEFPQTYAKAAYSAGTEEFAGNTAEFIKLVENYILSLFDFPEITGTADRYINNLTCHVQALREREKEARLNEKYLTAVEMASSDDILRLQECIGMFDELGDWKDSASLRENCVNRVLQQLSEKNPEEETDKSRKRRILSASENIKKNMLSHLYKPLDVSRRVAGKKSSLFAGIAYITVLVLVLFAFGAAYLIFMNSEIPDIPNGTAKFIYDGNENEINGYGEYYACIYEDRLLFRYITCVIYKNIDPTKEFAVTGTVCSDKEFENILKRRSIEFENGTKGWISYDEKTDDLKICYKGKIYLCRGYGI